MMTDQVTVEKADRIAIVRFDRGDHANLLSFAIMRELTTVAHDLADDPDLCAVVLTGRADNFSLGMDLKDEEVAKSATAGLAERRVVLKTGPRMCRAWEELDPLTIVRHRGMVRRRRGSSGGIVRFAYHRGGWTPLCARGGAWL
jgi:enoyl-CoA hydratase